MFGLWLVRRTKADMAERCQAKRHALRTQNRRAVGHLEMQMRRRGLARVAEQSQELPGSYVVVHSDPDAPEPQMRIGDITVAGDPDRHKVARQVGERHARQGFVRRVLVDGVERGYDFSGRDRYDRFPIGSVVGVVVSVAMVGMFVGTEFLP